MNELLLYLYGMITGLLFAVIIMYFGHLIIKALNHGFVGSPPKFKHALKAKLDRRTKDWQK